jgi:hypothetical protein
VYQPRRIETQSDWLDNDGLKIYCISYSGEPVQKDLFSDQLQVLKSSRDVAWLQTPGFAIFHEGVSERYLVLVYWGNDNEIFPIVSVETRGGWVEAPELYSFCLWDLEVMWGERQLYIDHCYSGKKDLVAYRLARPSIWVTSDDRGTPSAPLH